MHTPTGRVVWQAVFRPGRFDEKSPLTYQVSLVFPKGTDLSEMIAEATKVMTEKFGADQSKWPEPRRNPFRKCRERWTRQDGKDIIPPGYEDPEALFVSFNRSADLPQKPKVFDPNAQEMMDSSTFYSGCYARVDCNPFWYKKGGNQGISFGLNHVQKVRDGEKIGGGMPEPSFAPVAGASGVGGSSAATNVFGM